MAPYLGDVLRMSPLKQIYLRVVSTRASMSIMENAIEGVEARVLWSCKQGCVELLELGIREVSGFFRPFRYEVHIEGESSLFRSTSEHAARHYLAMLLGKGLGELEHPIN
ncbi:hypothetical protein [Marinobacter adhaerens]|uniref:hypothetical protein n=2 Tax=Marinobacter adhaerens TaxID=1033846 RepID=UPI003D139988